MSKAIAIDDLAAEITKGLEEYAELSATNMKKAVRKSARTVRKQIAETAPKNTGAYAKSWAVKTTKDNSHSLELTVHSKNRYQLAHLLEFGHAKRGGGRVPAQPHIASAEETGTELLEKEIKKSLGG